MGKIVAICLAFGLLFTFVFGLTMNSDQNMYPSVKDGDTVIFYRLNRSYIAGDVIVLTFEGRTQTRRVVATTGDVVDIMEGHLMINDAVQYEEEIKEPTNRYEDGADFPITLAEGQVFVLGDSRINATDSRIYGAVNTADTLGKVMAIFRRRGI